MPAAPYTHIRIVQSRHNARVKELRAALARPSAERVGLEGMHLVKEALESDLAVQTIFVRTGEEALLEALAAGLAPGRLGCVPEILSGGEEALRSAVTTETPQAIAALAVPPAFRLEALLPAAGPEQAALVLVLAGVQDPGNVGTILRSAEAFGAHGLLALPGTASVWNAKSLRASVGSAFRLPVIAATADQAFAWLGKHGVLSLAAVAPGRAQAKTPGSLDLGSPVALWIGSEGAGLAPGLVARCDAAVTIPCPRPVESLNAAIAASILLYEAARQRGSGLPRDGRKIHLSEP